MTRPSDPSDLLISDFSPGLGRDRLSGADLLERRRLIRPLLHGRVS
jgi:hypothetical protein